MSNKRRSTMNANENHVTARQLRIALTALDNQDMTIWELRTKLFKLDDQDTPVVIESSMWRKLGVENN